MWAPASDRTFRAPAGYPMEENLQDNSARSTDRVRSPVFAIGKPVLFSLEACRKLSRSSITHHPISSIHKANLKPRHYILENQDAILRILPSKPANLYELATRPTNGRD